MHQPKKKRKAPESDDKQIGGRNHSMKAKVIADQCIGDGICADTCPEVFEMGDDGLAHVIVDEVPADAEATCREAAEACPTEAIEISE
jgi:ferredoxin